jgi:tetratricopeptide (TPR) repeat protein
MVVTAGCGGRDVESTHAESLPTPDDLEFVKRQLVLDAVNGAQDEIRREPGSTMAWAQLGHVYLAHQWDAEAAECYRRAIEIDPNNVHWFYLLGRSLLLIDLEGSHAAFARFIELNDSYPLAYMWAGITAKRLSRTEEARRHFQRAFDLDPSNQVIALYLGKMALEEGKYESARDLLEKVIAIDPSSKKSHAALSEAYTALGQDDRARQHAEASKGAGGPGAIPDPLWKPVDMAATDLDSIINRARVALQMRDYPWAARELKVAANEKPSDPYLWLEYGVCLVLIGNDQGALNSLRKARLESDKADCPNPLDEHSGAALLSWSSVAHGRVNDIPGRDLEIRQLAASGPVGIAELIEVARTLLENGVRSDALSVLEAYRDAQNNPVFKTQIQAAMNNMSGIGSRNVSGQRERGPSISW